MALDLDPNHVFRDFVTPGIPSSGNWNPRKPEIRQLLTEWWQTLIALVADAGGLELPNLLIRYEVTGGDENNIVAEANLPVPSGPGVAVFSIVIEEANTGPVTINGKPLLSNTGNPLVAGALAADGIYLFLDNGDSYRLLSDYVSASIVAAAEAAAERAETFAAGVEFPVSFAPQTLTPEQQEQARENIGALSYDEQSLTPEQQQQARTNIGLGNLPSRAHISHIRNNASFPGIVYDRIVISGGPHALRMVSGDNMQSDGSIVPSVAKDAARRDGTRVVVNGSAFFNKGDGFYLPAGLYILDGVPYQEFSPTEERAQEAIIMYRDGVLRPARMSDGKTAAQYVAEGALWSTGWGYLLVVDGAKTSLPSNTFTTQVSARTVLGQRANGDYVILLVEGKTNDYGITLTQMQDLCVNEGLFVAMNLDGGGTTQCWWDTAYAHPSSDDTPRRVGNYLTANVAQLNPFDTGHISLPLETGVTASANTTYGNIGVRLRQINDEVSIHVSVNVSPNMTTGAYTLLTSGVPKRFWPDNGVLVRGMLSGASYRLVSLGMPHPLTGQLYARPQQQEENYCSGTVFYQAKWSD